MKNIFLVIAVSVFFLSCSKDDTCGYTDSTVIAPTSETASIETYLTNNGITGTTKHPSGFYYKINVQGTGASITNLCSYVVIKYTGKLTNGNIFDQDPGIGFFLHNLIIGWQKGLPLINVGGKITLYIPPSLGYGNYSPPGSNIPANSILIFDIELVSIS